ncbi:tetratricopeptide repeat protein [Brumimicrobium mesophilum]|uniref:tetratricopeptide repeat protein n=1 Tax=Brumimicrobium mesophilum TaxID=392717 RepID=UPI000D13FA74|nr:tetratricopeptide repeat protein [Brumimicrobium mesophilum]
MITPRGFLFLVSILLSTVVWSQSTKKYSGEYADFYRAEELFEKEQYGAAREVFTAFIGSVEDHHDPQYIKAKYYVGISALELYNSDAVNILLDFNNEYPESIYKNGIFFKLGEHFYQRKKYEDAKEWLDKTDPRSIDTSSIAAYHFKLGYSNFQLGNYTEARNEFFDIKDGNSSFSAPALYYYSHIAYKNETYREALDGFLKLKENPTFKDEVNYYLTQIYYLLGDYQKVTEFAPDFSVNENGISDNTAEMNLLIGDAYYKVEKYDKAVPFLEDYSNRKQMNREQSYSLAYSYFKNEEYDKAIRVFDRVSRVEDKLGQVAYYHIAQSYLYKEELNYARTAFRSASSDFDRVVQEDALYNYAVLSYKLDYNPYNEAIKAFELYLSEFPNSKRKEDVYSYMVNVYSSTKNYEEALKSLDRIPVLNMKLKTAYQVVSFNMGIEKYERGDYKGCVEALQGVSKYDVDPTVTSKAKFWEADAHYMLQEWKLAIKEFKEFLDVPGMNDLVLKEAAYYNIAYAYFMQEDWTQAIQAFRTFTQLTNIQDDNKLADAYARIGDGYFTKGNPDFQKSALNYEKALTYDIAKKDRYLYSLSKVYKLIPGKRDEQISTLNRILKDHPNSSFVIPAKFDIAMGYKNGGDYPKALTHFDAIVKNYPGNILVKDALIEIADIKFKQKEYTASESYFRRVLSEYTLDDETCKRATQGIVDVYRATRRQDEIIGLSKEYACADISEDDEEIFFYETASELYVNENYDEAIPEINKYLKRYPNGRFSVQLLSYLADIYYQRSDEDRAITYYENIINRPNSGYTEEALVRTSKLLYNSEQYSRALPHYEKLETLASKAQVIFNTRVGLMRTNFILENFSKAAVAANKVLNDELLDDKDIRIEGNYIAGMSLFNTKQYQQSLASLRWTADNTGKVRGTEALYTLTKAYYSLENYTKAEALHNELLQRKPAYDFWIAKSLILQARVFMMTDDLFQAEQTINLVINNYPNKEDGVLLEADKVKSELMQLKDSPDEFEDDTNRMIDINNGEDE